MVSYIELCIIYIKLSKGKNKTLIIHTIIIRLKMKIIYNCYLIPNKSIESNSKFNNNCVII